ncbi:Kinesin-like protein KIF11 [Porphyridium purpureum]|uniref:Kinesin-like protein KIF11 n=1 Tax=Porphyridium purpureum TaxID=35688 RepID=A0A5J4Z661_PORPP|nr:Kinesin-like protein KIF11 [Porphyridium purpureum]|eukprot:POR7541..scf295_1
MDAERSLGTNGNVRLSTASMVPSHDLAAGNLRGGGGAGSSNASAPSSHHAAPAPPKDVNVQVFLRCRPMNSKEKTGNERCVVSCLPPNAVHLTGASNSGKASSAVSTRNGTLSSSSVVSGSSLAGNTATSGGTSNGSSGMSQRKYQFDRVFGPESTQQEVYDYVAAPIVEEVLQGYNCTVFAYGQTGTGKTHTMEGQKDFQEQTMEERRKVSEHAGVIPRAISHIFSYLREHHEEYTVRVSHLELYNEQLSDLLSVGGEGESDALRIFDDASKGTFVHGLEEIPVRTEEEIFAVLDKSAQKRRTAETLMNKFSSRSHSVFTVTIHIREATPDGEDLLKIGKLNLVDLAGSEDVRRSGAQNQRAREAGNINQSLLTLGRVITALVEKHPHVPYRDSKLTRLLQESLGGKNKTSIIATIGPGASSVEETGSTLEYAYRAKSIKNRPQVNQMMTKRALIKEYMDEIASLKRELDATRSKNGIFIPPEDYEKLMLNNKGQGERITELSQQVEESALKLEAERQTREHQALLLSSVQARLVDTEDRLRAKVSELETCEHWLEQTKLERDEAEHAVKQFQDTERALTEQACGVRDTLCEAVADLNVTHERLANAKTVDAANAKASAALHKDLSAKLEAMQENMETESQRCIQGLARLGSKSSETGRRQLALVARLDEALCGVVARTQEFHQRAWACSEKGSTCAANAVALFAEEEAEAQEAIRAQVSELRELLSSETGSVLEQLEQCASLMKGSSTKGEESVQHIRQMLDGIQIAHAQLLSETCAAYKREVEQMSLQHDNIEQRLVETEQTHAVELEKMQLAVQGAVQAAMAQFVHDSKATISQQNAGMRKQVGAGRAALKKVNNVLRSNDEAMRLLVENETELIMNQLENHSVHAREHALQMQEHFNGIKQTAEHRLGKGADTCLVQLVGTAAVRSATATQLGTSMLSQLTEHTAQGSKIWQEGFETITRERDELSVHARNASTELVSEMEVFGTGLATVEELVRNELSAKFSRSCTDAKHRVQVYVERDVQRVDSQENRSGGTGTSHGTPWTPARKQWKYPSEFCQTSDRMELRRQFLSEIHGLEQRTLPLSETSRGPQNTDSEAPSQIDGWLLQRQHSWMQTSPSQMMPFEDITNLENGMSAALNHAGGSSVPTPPASTGTSTGINTSTLRSGRTSPSLSIEGSFANDAGAPTATASPVRLVRGPRPSKEQLNSRTASVTTPSRPRHARSSQRGQQVYGL